MSDAISDNFSINPDAGDSKSTFLLSVVFL
jgi:hypothetical protein